LIPYTALALESRLAEVASCGDEGRRTGCRIRKNMAVLPESERQARVVSLAL
jgi:hypothetical protein